MILEVIITTMNENIHRALKLIQPFQKNIIYQISHQITKHESNVYYQEISSFLESREDVSYFYYKDKGLSLNRNHSISNSKGDICLVADDDIEYKEGACLRILEAFKRNPEADIITFKTEFPNGIQFKKYRNKCHQHNFRTVMRVTSFEIAYRRRSIELSGLKWDENFGLGGKPFTNGIENIFLVDALGKDLQVLFVPNTIVVHPFENSGYTYSEHLIESKGAMFARMFGRNAYWLNFLFAVKKYKDYRNVASFLKFFRLANRGSNKFLKMH
jgi:glycosyltransferase involved in cell wall biosynthesis